MSRCRSALRAAALLCALAAQPLHAQQDRDPRPIEAVLLESLEWRSIGPANFGGRITDIEGIPSPSKTFFVAAATGGIWKTTNNGTTFRPVFDGHRVISMGDLAIAPSDTMQIWAGTGEEDSRNSISPGGGIYKSTDGGLTWKLMGLEKTQAIGRIVIHPTNPDIVWVAALGAIWNESPDRGLYKTTDGGKTWRRVKFVSERAGFVDIAIHPRNPDILFAASWERIRGPYFLESGGPGSALWKSTDGGETWTEVKGGGFPETEKGRIGIAIAPSDPDVVYALVEAEAPDGEEGGCRAAKPGGCGLYRSEDGGRTWTWMNGNNVRPFYYSQVRVDPENPDRVYWSSTPVNFSDDGGKTVRQTTLGIHVDHHAMWIDPNDGARFVVGNDGGIAITFDRGGNYDFRNVIPLGQFYEVAYGMDSPYTVCGGLQDNGTWCGPSRLSDGEITNYHWTTVWGGDGFHAAIDPRDADIVYAESQGGNMGRFNRRTGERTTFDKPDWRERYRMWEDSILVLTGGADEPPNAEVARQVERIRRQQKADSAALELRFNWNTPFLLSPHDPDVFYAAGNRVLKSTKMGEELVPISPDLTYADTMKIRVSTETTGGITPDVTGAETHATIVALAESPLRRGWLFAGTDDGRVWVTRNDGGDWQELTGRFRGVPRGTWVRRIEPSHHDPDRFYVVFDGHRTGDFKPYVFVTDDGGRRFRSIVSNLPSGGPQDFVHVIREDPYDPDLLFVGTDIGVYVSLDRGASWTRFMNGLPTVPVHDLKIHPRDRELIAATHGRSIWIVDIAPLEQLDAEWIAQDGPVLFEPVPAQQFATRPVGGESAGHGVFEAPSPEYGAAIVYYVPAPAEAVAAKASGDAARDGDAAGAAADRGRGERPSATITILGADGDTVRTLTGPATPGLHRVYWDFRGEAPPAPPLTPAQRRDSIAAMARVEVVADSLVAAGVDSALVARAKRMLTGGDDFRRLFRRGGGARERGFVERPGESPPPSGRRGGGEDVDREALFDVLRAFRDAGLGGRRGLAYRTYTQAAGGERPTAEPGTYTVALTIDGVTRTQPLRVERAPALDAGRIAAGGEGDGAR
ncbi:MAG TPA: hypothetical protein VF158_16890 [Longimicrobiales bacterium]